MTLWSDVAYALRAFAKKPVFTVVAVVTLALGIGANTAIFSVVNGLLLLPLPLPDADELVLLDGSSEAGFNISVSIPNYFSWEEMASGFEAIGAGRGTSLNLTGGDQPERLQAVQVLGDFFGALGVVAHRGTTFARDETLQGAERQAVLSYGLWQRSFGGESDIVGKNITLDGLPFTILGVMPEKFVFRPGTEIWVPMGVYADTLPWDKRGNSPGINAVARLKPGISLEQAVADMDAVGKRVQEDTGWTGMPRTRSARQVFLGPVEQPVMVLFAAVGFVLLIACANVANLLLARSEERRREIAVRTAMGAGRLRILRQLLTESILLGLGGGLAGLVVAYWGVQALVASLPGGIPLVDRIAVDPNVLAYCLAISVVTGIVFGFVPAVQASRIRFHDELKEGGRSQAGASGGRLRSALVTLEIALALGLLIVAGLLIKSFGRLQQVDPGFQSAGVFNATVSLPQGDYENLPEWYAFYERFIERVKTVPGVMSVAVNNGVPLAAGGTESGSVPDSRAIERGSMTSCLYQAVSGDYFQTLGIPLLQGRSFTPQDREDRTLVAVVDQTMAREFWPEENPIGRRVAFEFRGEGENLEPIWREVVGVVGHVRHYELRSESRVQIYAPFTQPPVWFQNRRPPMALFVKTAGEPEALAGAIREELHSLDANLPLYNVQTMEDVLFQEMGTDSILSNVLTVFSLVALVLAAVGIYGLMAYGVSRRTRELGLRMALGAKGGEVLGLVMRRSILMTCIGLALGLAMGFALSRLLSSLLFEVSTSDPTVFAGVALLLGAIAVLASYLPARRAAQVDPVIALRHE